MRKPLITIATAAALAVLPASGAAAIEPLAAPHQHDLERAIAEDDMTTAAEVPEAAEAESAPPSQPDEAGGFAAPARVATETADERESGGEVVEPLRRSLVGSILSGLLDLVVPGDGPASGEAVAAQRYEGGATGDGPATEEECERTAEVASEAQEIADQDYANWQNGGGSGAMWGYLHMQMSVNTVLDGALERGCFFLDHGDSKSSQ